MENWEPEWSFGYSRAALGAASGQRLVAVAEACGVPRLVWASDRSEGRVTDFPAKKPIEVVRQTHAGPEPGKPIGGIYCRCGHHDIDHINPRTGWPRGACASCDCESFAYRTGGSES